MNTDPSMPGPIHLTHDIMHEMIQKLQRAHESACELAAAQLYRPCPICNNLMPERSRRTEWNPPARTWIGWKCSDHWLVEKAVNYPVLKIT